MLFFQEIQSINPDKTSAADQAGSLNKNPNVDNHFKQTCKNNIILIIQYLYFFRYFTEIFEMYIINNSEKKSFPYFCYLKIILVMGRPVLKLINNFLIIFIYKKLIKIKVHLGSFY